MGADGAAEPAVSTPTEAQRLRKPSYFAKPVIRAAPVLAAQQQEGIAGEDGAAQPQQQQQQQQQPASAPAKKELPALLRARLAKRGILSQVCVESLSRILHQDRKPHMHGNSL